MAWKAPKIAWACGPSSRSERLFPAANLVLYCWPTMLRRAAVTVKTYKTKNAQLRRLNSDPGAVICAKANRASPRQSDLKGWGAAQEPGGSTHLPRGQLDAIAAYGMVCHAEHIFLTCGRTVWSGPMRRRREWNPPLFRPSISTIIIFRWWPRARHRPSTIRSGRASEDTVRAIQFSRWNSRHAIVNRLTK